MSPNPRLLLTPLRHTKVRKQPLQSFAAVLSLSYPQEASRCQIATTDQACITDIDVSWGLQVIHFIRHGEGYHNLGHEHLHDPHLTSLGWAQAHALQEHLTSSLPPLNIQVTLLHQYLMSNIVFWSGNSIL